MGSTIESAPSLGRSDDSAIDYSSGPATPSDRSPYISGHTYAIPQPLETIALPQRVGTPQPSLHAVLPDILHPETAASVPIRHVCCIGAGYVGTSIATINQRMILDLVV